ncbi:MAG: MBL fold metallo-hydrolase [Planctomycetes bacterium]|nr:MBL fold metallo-hydrolase [Planctomycetota bacterium]
MEAPEAGRSMVSSSEPISSATVLVLAPDAAGELQLVCVHRDPSLSFLGGFAAFPGGQCDPGESLAETCAREAFEEVGLLLVPGGDAVPPARRHALQAEVLAGKPFADVLVGLGLQLEPSWFVRCGRWVTPPSGSALVDTAFRMVLLERPTPLHVVPGELTSAEWVSPRALLERWTGDRVRLVPPTRKSVEALSALPALAGGAREAWLGAAAAAVEARCPSAAAQWEGDVDVHPGIRVFPVRTPTLPPATHTNCYVVGAGSELVVIDPASPYPEEQARLDAFLDALAAGGQRVREILLTHHHPDHVGGVNHLARRLGVPVAAHPRTTAHLTDVEVSRELADQELIVLPADRPNARERRLRAHLTEGHADGHLVFHEEHTGVVVTGDMVAGVGTILVAPPEGCMITYLASLERMRALGGTLLLPAHGLPLGDPDGTVTRYVAHRKMREDRVVAALARGAGTLCQLVPRVYDDVPREVYPLAERSLHAILLKLEAEGRAAVADTRWSATG